MASFDENGLQVDRLSDILRQIQDNQRVAFGASIDLDERQPIGVLNGIMAERFTKLHELLEATYLASFPATSYGIYLDYICALNGIVRKPATASTVDLTFTRSNEASAGNVVISQGTIVKQDDNISLSWATNSETFIAQGETEVTIRATCSETGPNTAGVNTLTFMPLVPTNVASVTNKTAAAIGEEEESDAELRARREESLAKAGTATQLGIQTAIRNLVSIQTATVVVNDTDVTDADGRPPHSFEAFISPVQGNNIGQFSTIVFSNNTPPNNTTFKIKVNDIDYSSVVYAGDFSATIASICTSLEESPLILEASPSIDFLIISVTSTDSTSYTLSVEPSYSQDTQLLFSDQFAADDTIVVKMDGVEIYNQIFDGVDQATEISNIAVALIGTDKISDATLSGLTALDLVVTGEFVLDIATTESGVTNNFQFNTTTSVVSQGTDLSDQIAQTIWDSKAAGINTFGDLQGIATDEDGASHVVYFSAVDAKEIYVKYTLITDSTLDPDYESKIINALSNYADLNYTIAVDVINYQLVCVAGHLELSGVLGISVETSLDGASYSSPNVIEIGPEEFAEINANTISVVIGS